VERSRSCALSGIKDRKPETKKTALKVVAALAALILDIRDILPYLGILMKNLKVMVFHNLPDIRVEAAKALGAIVNEVGHEDIYFPGNKPLCLPCLYSASPLLPSYLSIVPTTTSHRRSSHHIILPHKTLRHRASHRALHQVCTIGSGQRC
jgi:hypothetical protein